MKIISILLFLISGLVFSQNQIPSGYHKIPEILDNPELLYPFIIPDKKYEYWSVFRNNPDPDEAIIYESQTPEYMTINDPAPEKGFFQKCLGESCFIYLIACQNGRSKYFSSEQQLREFIGTVDNLPEAILIANTYGYTVDTADALGSSYAITDELISLYISKPSTAARESFLIEIDRKTGRVKAKSYRTY